MKHLTAFTLIFTLLFYSLGKAQEIPEDAIMIQENTVIKDDSGNEIEQSRLMKLLSSGEWALKKVIDKEGKLLYIQLRKATEEEKIQIQQPSTSKSTNKVGEKAPSFSMMDMDGNPITSENAKGKVVVLNFWFAACKPCIAEIPELNEVYHTYKDNPNVIFASITFDKKERVETFLKEHPIKYPIVSNAKPLGNLFNVKYYPTNIVIDKNGNYHSYIYGSFPKIGEHISKSILEALNNKKPNITTKNSDSNRLFFSPNASFKLEDGELISREKAFELISTNKYGIQPPEDNEQEVYLIKKLNEK